MVDLTFIGILGAIIISLAWIPETLATIKRKKSNLPKNMLLQQGGGPAVGVLQIEPITAIDHIKRALNKSSGEPQHRLVTKIFQGFMADPGLEAEILGLGFSKSDEVRMKDLLIQHRVLQVLVWRLFLDNSLAEIPQTRDGL